MVNHFLILLFFLGIVGPAYCQQPESKSTSPSSIRKFEKSEQLLQYLNSKDYSESIAHLQIRYGQLPLRWQAKLRSCFGKTRTRNWSGPAFQASGQLELRLNDSKLEVLDIDGIEALDLPAPTDFGGGLSSSVFAVKLVDDILFFDLSTGCSVSNLSRVDGSQRTVNWRIELPSSSFGSANNGTRYDVSVTDTQLMLWGSKDDSVLFASIELKTGRIVESWFFSPLY